MRLQHSNEQHPWLNCASAGRAAGITGMTLVATADWHGTSPGGSCAFTGTAITGIGCLCTGTAPCAPYAGLRAAAMRDAQAPLTACKSILCSCSCVRVEPIIVCASIPDTAIVARYANTYVKRLAHAQSFVWPEMAAS